MHGEKVVCALKYPENALKYPFCVPERRRQQSSEWSVCQRPVHVLTAAGTVFLPGSDLSQPTCLLICIYHSDLPHSITASPIAWSVATKISLPIVPAVMTLFHLGPGRPLCYTPTQTIGHVSLLKTQSTVLRIVISQTLELLSLEVCVSKHNALLRHS